MKSVSVVLLLLLGASCTVVKNKTSGGGFAPNPVTAHRGAFLQKGLPENSIAALQEAIRLGCTGSEFDVRLTADDSLIINHDPQYRQMNIETTTYATLLTKPLANGETLPTLRQYLRAGLQNNRQTRLVLEVKPSSTSKERGLQIAEKVVQLVNELQAAPMVVYISFDYDILKRIAALQPGAPTQYLNGDRTPQQLKEDGIAGLDYHISVYKKNEAWIAQAQQLQLQLNAWTVNHQEDMQWLLARGFQFITTDKPALLLQVYQSRR